MKTELTSETVVASPIDDATAGRRISRRSGLVAGVSLLCAGLVACVESGSGPTTTAPRTAAAPPPLPPILPFDQAVANAANTVFTAAPAGSLSRGHRSAGRWRHRLWLAGDGRHPGPGHGSGAEAVSALLHREVLAGRPERLAPGAGRDLHAGHRPEPDGRHSRGLSLLPRARRSQDGQGRRQGRRPLPAHRRRCNAEHRLPRQSGMDDRSRARRPISAPARPPRSAIPSTRNSSTGSGRRR